MNQAGEISDVVSLPSFYVTVYKVVYIATLITNNGLSKK